jgi:hypothetical protein
MNGRNRTLPDEAGPDNGQIFLPARLAWRRNLKGLP